MDTPNSTPLAPLAGHPNQGAQSLRSWLNANGGKLGLGLTALVALSLMPFASLTIQAFAMIVAFMALIMTKRMSVLTALIIVPIVFALLGGFGPEIGPMMLDGVKAIAPTAAMLMFAILFFGPYLAVITGVLSLPFTFFISNDAFYYGVVPILSQAAEAYGISAAEIGRASLVGQPVHLLSPLVPSTYLLVALVGVELGDHQRFTLKWTIITPFILLGIGLATATIPLSGGTP